MTHALTFKTTHSWKTIAAIILAGFAVLFFVGYGSVYRMYGTLEMKRAYGAVDFAVFYVAGSTLTGTLEFHPADLYVSKTRMAVIQSIRPQSGGTRYLYPPQATFFFAPFALLPFRASTQLWSVMIAAAFVASYYLTIASLLKNNPWRVRYSLLLIALALSEPITGLMSTGQINSFILLGMILTLIGVTRNRWMLSGVSLGIVITLKVFPVVLLPYLVLKKQWKACAVTIATIAVLWLGSLPIYGFSATQRYFEKVLPTITGGSFIGGGTSLYGSLTTSAKQGLLAETDLSKRSMKKVISWTRLVLMGVVGAGIAWLLYRNRRSLAGQIVLQEYGVIMLFVLLFSKSIHTQYHLFLIPVFLWMLSFPLQFAYWKSHMILFLSTFFTHYRSWLPLAEGKLILLFKPGTLGMIILLIYQLVALCKTTDSQEKKNGRTTHGPH